VATVLGYLWPIAMIIVAWFVYQRIFLRPAGRGDGAVRAELCLDPRRPWALAGCTGVALVALTWVARNRMTGWLTLVRVFLALCHSSGGQQTPGIH
jgi:hypothetical protein